MGWGGLDVGRGKRLADQLRRIADLLQNWGLKASQASSATGSNPELDVIANRFKLIGNTLDKAVQSGHMTPLQRRGVAVHLRAAADAVEGGGSTPAPRRRAPG